MLPLRNCVKVFKNVGHYWQNSFFTVRTLKANATQTSTNSTLKNTIKLSALGIGVGTIGGTGYSIHLKNNSRRHIINEETVIKVVQEIPKIEPSRKIRIPGDQTGLRLTLYQYENCPFCCKVRAFLDFYGISYDVVEVDPVLRQAVKWSEYRKVPIVVAEVEDGYQPLIDSSMIISALASYLQNTNKDFTAIVKSYPSISYYDTSGTVKNDIMNKYFLMLDEREEILIKDSVKEERKWRKWTDDTLVHSLSPNVYRTWNEALQAFNCFSQRGEWDKHFPSWEKFLMIYVGAFAMLIIGKRLKKRHNLKDDVRESLYDDCNHFAKAIKAKGTQFLGGNAPNLADLAVYGVLNSIEGCDAFQDLLIHSHIRTWYFSMKEAVINHLGSGSAQITVRNY